jgi:hypothetical protein
MSGAIDKAAIEEEQGSNVQVTVQDKVKSLQGDEKSDVRIEPLRGVTFVPSQSDEDSRSFDRTDTAFVPKLLELRPPDGQDARPIEEAVFSAPLDEVSVKTERASPTKKAEVLTSKNLALVVGILAFGFFLAM